MKVWIVIADYDCIIQGVYDSEYKANEKKKELQGTGGDKRSVDVESYEVN